MNDTLQCPGCHARLTLLAVPDGQSVQCPRCQQVFDPSRGSSRAARPALSSAVGASGPGASDDPVFFEVPHRLIPVGSLWGGWFAIVAMLAIVATLPGFLCNAYAELLFLISAIGEGTRFHRYAWQCIELTSWPAILAFVIWLSLTSHNATVLQARGPLFSPAGVLVMLCVPLVNMIVAYLTLQELWKSSHPRAIADLDTWREVPASWLVRLAGLNFLCAPFLIFICFQLDHDFRIHHRTMKLVACIANLNLVIGGVLLIVVIFKIMQRQRQRFERLYEDAA